MDCLDTYALVEIQKGSSRYLPFLDDTFIICDLTMAEFYAVMLREHDEKMADHWHKKLVFYCRPVDLDLLIRAVKFRLENKEKNFSLTDAVGYEFARSNGCAFVTGDEGFRGLASVKFIK